MEHSLSDVLMNHAARYANLECPTKAEQHMAKELCKLLQNISEVVDQLEHQLLMYRQTCEIMDPDKVRELTKLFASQNRKYAIVLDAFQQILEALPPEASERKILYRALELITKEK